MKRFYAFWLTLSLEDTRYLQQIITSLSQEYNAPLFEPHITLYGVLNTNLETVTGIADSSAKNTSPFHLEAERVESSEALFKTVFIQIKTDPTLSTFQKKMEQESPEKISYQFDPHISLVYKLLSDDIKKDIIKNLSIKKSFTFDSIAIVDLGDTAEDLYKIADWRIVHKAPLQ